MRRPGHEESGVLFDEPGGGTARGAPLAARTRPQTLEEFVGQEHLLAPGKALRQAIEQDNLSSCIFYGPAGCGKSTLAHIIAGGTKAHFETYSAVTSGVAEMRRVMARAAQRRTVSRQQTILFVDEIHRPTRLKGSWLAGSFATLANDGVCSTCHS